MNIAEGEFLIKERSVGGTSMAQQPPVRIESSDTIGFKLGRDAVFGRTGNVTVPIMIEIKGDGALRADGTFGMYVDHSSEARDQFVVDEQIIFDDNAAVKTYWFAAGDPDDYWLPGSHWTLFKSLSAAEEPINAVPASFTKPPAAPSLELLITPDKKEVRVRRDA